MVNSAEINTLARAIIDALPKQDRILTAEQVAQMLDRPVEKINRLCSEGKLHGKKFGKKWYFKESELIECIFPEEKKK